MRREIWKQYRRGQEVDKKPSEEYLVAVRAAIDYVATRDQVKQQLELTMKARGK